MDFPLATDRSLVAFGAPIDWLPRAMRNRRAIGVIALGSFVSPVTERSSDTLFTDLVDSDEFQSWTIDDYNWYVSFVIERDVEVGESEQRTSQYFWLEPTTAIRLRNEFLESITSSLDILGAYASSVIESTFLEHVIVDDRVFYRAEGREPFGLPDWTLNSPSLSFQTGSSPDFEPVRRRFQQITRLPIQRHDWLRRISHWHLAALVERDLLKRFLWSYFALEALTQRMSKNLTASVVGSLQHGSESEAANRNPQSIANLLWEESRMPLASRFSIMALAFYPETADDDTAAFRRIKQARDNLAHGNTQSVETLPIRELRSLLDRYLKAAVDHQLS